MLGTRKVSFKVTSEGKRVTSGDSQRSVLVPFLFNTFISDLEKGVRNEISKLMDFKDSKWHTGEEELLKHLAELSEGQKCVKWTSL